MMSRFFDQPRLRRPLALAVMTLAAATPLAALAGSIVLTPEEPGAGSTYSGVANLRGWAVSTAGMERIELYIDGGYVTDIPMGGYRADVQGAYPNYPDSLYSGYSMAYNYGKLDDGSHTFTVRAVDNDGAVYEYSANVQVTGFLTTFISDPSSVSLNGATVTGNGNTLQINGMTAQGQSYNLSAQWSGGAQGMRLNQVAANQSQGGGGTGTCTDVGWPAAGTKVSFQVSGYMAEYDANVTGTVSTTYEELDTSHARTQTTGTLSALGYTINTSGAEVQGFYIQNGMLYSTYIAGAHRATVAGYATDTVELIEYDPARLLHPATHFCQGQTWTSPSVQMTLTYSVAGYEGTLSEGTMVETGAVESINTSVTVPAGTYTTVQYRIDHGDGTSTRTWVDVVTGMDVKTQVIDTASGAVIMTQEVTSLQ